MFEAASQDRSIIVQVGRNGNTEHVQLEAAAMELGDVELCNRIVRLSTLGVLRSQLALRLEMESNHVMVQIPLPTEQQVDMYAASIDF
ncbi:hypothetical protein [Mycobacteroides abscessus]|uniref:hypothetical protein n=1 Tax=Mycobacteroides abscessus TaxID=36809 RepID=UPI0009A91018|nr:hypothetical protein [Mycobacteroides abscessus]SLF48483.1 Uncharacterised protein [Mycobacteroides abscessus subsp. abscessus]